MMLKHKGQWWVTQFEHDALRAENDELRDAISIGNEWKDKWKARVAELEKVLSIVRLDCENLHHGKGQFHGAGPCPVEQYIDVVMWKGGK